MARPPVGTVADPARPGLAERSARNCAQLESAFREVVALPCGKTRRLIGVAVLAEAGRFWIPHQIFSGAVMNAVAGHAAEAVALSPAGAEAVYTSTGKILPGNHSHGMQGSSVCKKGKDPQLVGMAHTAERVALDGLEQRALSVGGVARLTDDLPGI